MLHGKRDLAAVIKLNFWEREYDGFNGAPPQNSYVEAFTLNESVFGERAYKEELRFN